MDQIISTKPLYLRDKDEYTKYIESDQFKVAYGEYARFFNKNEGYKSFARTVGHCAVHIENETADYYCSLYPKTEKKDLHLLLNLSKEYPSNFAYSIDVDCEEIGQPDVSITLKTLNENKIVRLIEHFNKKYSRYSLYTNNCSNLAFDILHNGAEGKETDFFYEIKKFGKDLMNAGGLLECAFHYFKEKDYRTYGRDINFAPMLSVTSVLHLCGYQTPYSIFSLVKYAQKKELGK